MRERADRQAERNADQRAADEAQRDALQADARVLPQRAVLSELDRLRDHACPAAGTGRS